MFEPALEATGVSLQSEPPLYPNISNTNLPQSQALVQCYYTHWCTSAASSHSEKRWDSGSPNPSCVQKYSIWGLSNYHRLEADNHCFSRNGSEPQGQLPEANGFDLRTVLRFWDGPQRSVVARLPADPCPSKSCIFP
jgi:hypothetical protein